MNEGSANPCSELDRIRNTGGAEDLALYFSNTAREDRHEALRLLNDDKLLFASLFTLREAVIKSGLQRHLCSRNTLSLLFSEYVMNGKSTRVLHQNRLYQSKIRDTLRWVIESGEENLDSDFDNVVDTAAVILLKKYKDKTVIPAVTDIIFERNRREAYTYDLIWGLFESSDPEVLIRISERLASSDEKDAELAQRLLSFIPGGEKAVDGESIQKNWIQENFNFLYYTGETHHQSCSPRPFAVSREAKYICKPISPERGNFPEPLTRKDHKVLTHFSALDDHTKELLSDYSAKLSRSEPDKWALWLESPISDQIIQAVRAKGGIL